MQIEYRPGDYKDLACDLLAYPVFEEDSADGSLESLYRLTRGAVKTVLASGEFKPELHKVCKIFKPAGLKTRYLLLLGAGKKAQFEPARLREIAGTAVRSARLSIAKTMALWCRGSHPAGLSARLVAEGSLYANYESDFYKTRDKEQQDVERFLVLFEKKAPKQLVRDGIRQGIIVGDATNFARNLTNEPANILTPSQFAARAVAVAGKTGLTARVMEQEEMANLGMNALLAVSRGSDEPPKLIILQTHRDPGRKRSPVYALIGKGVTFDSGGISIKHAEGMEDMKGDMSGGAAVLGAMLSLGQLRPKHPVIGIIPAVENLPSGKAVKPGDVVKSYNGKTVEIINTDAEGRLILADALAYARTLGATHLIDIATLTGSITVALGRVHAGMMGTDQKTMDRLGRNCRNTGEGLWQMPLDDEYRKAIRSEIADIKNVGNRMAGAITAAKFLQEFVEDTPWVHLDIAAMDIDHDGRPFACKGATGFGVRTLVQLLE
jgi:leucyl aminopeptidase